MDLSSPEQSLSAGGKFSSIRIVILAGFTAKTTLHKRARKVLYVDGTKSIDGCCYPLLHDCPAKAHHTLGLGL